MPKLVWRQILILALVAFVFNAYLIYRAPVEPERVAAVSYSLLKEEARRSNIQEITFQDKTIEGVFREPIALNGEKTAPDSAVLYPRFSATLPPFDLSLIHI